MSSNKMALVVFPVGAAEPPKCAVVCVLLWLRVESIAKSVG